MSANDNENGVSATIKRLGVLAGAISSILLLIFLLFPKLKPVVTEPPPKNVTLRDITVHHSGKIGGDNCYHRVTIFFKARIEGYKDKSLPIYWDLENADSKTPYTHNFTGCPPVLGANAPSVEGEARRWRGHPGNPTSEFRPTSQNEAFAGEIWVDTRLRGGVWKVRLEVIDPEGKLVGSAETEPFPIPQ